MFTGFDNELLQGRRRQASASRPPSAGTDSPACSRRWLTTDVGSSSITTTDERRQTVDFTNGYDFGYFSLVAPPDGKVTSFS